MLASALVASRLTDYRRRMSSKWIGRLDGFLGESMNSPENQITRLVTIALVLLIIVFFVAYQLQRP
jgi:hypothetical protein